MDWEKIFLDQVQGSFLLEVVFRSVFMFALILAVLRMSGRRGVRQLTLFEVAIILGLGSAAGDPMFQKDIPLIHSFVVLLTVILFYKVITWAVARFPGMAKVFEGEEMIIVQDGMFHVANGKKADFSQNEFYAELRNYSVEHLGQVRLAILEIDGSLSILRYPKNEIQYGLPLFPGAHKKVDPHSSSGPFACMFCGQVETKIKDTPHACPRCTKEDWTPAINTPPYS